MSAPSYQATIEQVGTAIRSAFGAIDGWFEKPAGLRSHKPASGGWSIDEVLEHITLTRNQATECLEMLDSSATARDRSTP